MKLLHFAHRPEAKAFLENSDFALIKEAKIDLYYSNHLDLALVISGEGHLKALEACLQSILFLEFNWKKPVQEIINLGICGALNQQIQKNEIVQPRYSLLINANQTPIFQSYESHNELNAITCLTTEERIQSTEAAEKLHQFGDIVDRELWGVLRAAALSHIPVYSTKVVSDNARTVQCDLIREEAYHYSMLLKSWFEKNQLMIQPQNLILNVEIFLQKAKIYQHPDLHFTQTQKHQIKKLYHGLKIQNEDEENLFLATNEITDILTKDWTPKKKATEIIVLLQSRLNPYMANWQKDFQTISKPLRQENIQFHIDPKLESTHTTFNFECKDEQDFKNKINALTHFSYHEFGKLMLGQYQTDKKDV